MNSIFEHYLHSRDDEEEDKDIHPYDNLFGKEIVRRVTNPKKSYIEKLKFDEFKGKVKWDNQLGFPQFLIELLIYISGFNLTEYIENKQLREKEEKGKEEFKK